MLITVFLDNTTDITEIRVYACAVNALDHVICRTARARIWNGDVKMRAPYFLVTIVIVLALSCGPLRCNASKFFGILTAACICHFTLAMFSDGDQEQTSSIPKLVLSIATMYVAISSCAV